MKHPLTPATKITFSEHAENLRMIERNVTKDDVLTVIGFGPFWEVTRHGKAEYYGCTADGRPLTVSVSDGGHVITVIGPSIAEWLKGKK